jgi:uncharacterized phage-associated protein
LNKSTYTAFDVADWFLSKVNPEAGDTISPLKLQKLVYYAQAWHLALFGSAIFDEQIEAWKDGPVVPSLYDRFKSITRFENIDVSKNINLPLTIFEQKTEELLNEIRIIYGERSGEFLRDLTHSEKPWVIARGNTPPMMRSNAAITHESMIEFYTALNNGQQSSPAESNRTV